MKVVKEVWIAGRTIGVVIKLSTGDHTKRRAPKKNITSEKVRRNNNRLAARNLTMLINANFGKGDAHYTLTHAEEVTQKQAERERSNFLRRLSARFKKAGKELKYIAVTEYKNKRIHHHILINSSDLKLIEEVWGKGHVHCTRLDDTGEYQELAEYLIKETQKTFREKDSAHKSRYSPSRNLIKPIIKRDENADIRELFKDPEPISGYYIPENRIRRYTHPVTGLEYLEYIMVAIDKPRRYKVWPRGKVVSGKEYYKINYEEEQETFMTDDIQAILECGKESK